MTHMHYTEFRSRVYALIDLAEQYKEDPEKSSVHIELEDDIDQLLIDLMESIHE